MHLDPQRGLLRTTLSEIEFDDLVIATGARPRNPFPKAPDGVFTLRTLTDAHLLRERLRSCRHLVVIGGGFIGLEVAASARASGVDVTVVEVAEIPLSRNLGASVAPILGDLARDHGVRLICGRSVADLEGTDRIERVVLDDGQAIDADLVLVGVGAVPNVEWLDGSGWTPPRPACTAIRPGAPATGMGRRRRRVLGGRQRRPAPPRTLDIRDGAGQDRGSQSHRDEKRTLDSVATCGRTSSGVESTSSATPQVTPPCGSSPERPAISRPSTHATADSSAPASSVSPA
ncbi:FAD-dependent oxidoreductase [Rhodococcus hoagii]|nr:FAD-dependent oxidoreductase [Prescottella equi]